MPTIVLMTFNARYHHASFGLRYLKANLGALAENCAIVEFDLEKRPAEALEQVLAMRPSLIGMGVYVWNTRQSLEFAQLLKAIRPDLPLVVGGPEVSFPNDQHPVADVADHVVCGEADRAFADLVNEILAGRRPEHTILAKPPDLPTLAMPYPLYSEEDIAHRTIYVESSRGCPFSCEFCLSSLDIPLRRFPLDAFLSHLQSLLDRGARQFKFVDRTFNVNVPHAHAILSFLLDRVGQGLFAHFELIPDHLPEAIFELLQRFPPGSLQLEIGVQTFNEQVALRIGRKQDNALVERNLQRLRQQTHAHIHADLIAGLPGESLESFSAGFDRLAALQPHEIQLGILKRLRGAPIARHTSAFAMVYSPDAPYELLQNDLLDFATMQRIKRMSRYWDLFANSGNFTESLPLICGREAFSRFLTFSDLVYQTTGKTHQIALPRQFELAYEFLGRSEDAGRCLASDYLRPGRRDLPAFLQQYAGTQEGRIIQRGDAPPRQSRHLASRKAKQ